MSPARAARFPPCLLYTSTGYCAGWSLKQLIQEGLGGIPGKITSAPASHLATLCNQMVNFLGIMQNEWAGAQAFSSFDTYLAPFVKVLSLIHILLAALALLAAVVIGFSLTVFAYFSDSLVNAGNTITAGWFSADLAVVADAEQPAEGDNLLDENNGIQGIDKTVTLDG